MPIRKRGHFTDEMSAGKFKKRKIYIEKRKSLKIKVLRFLVPGAGDENGILQKIGEFGFVYIID